ncbi:MAG: Gmad2 immunoglobulin-like domain-containing protein [Gemmatimonadota bacterium]
MTRHSRYSAVGAAAALAVLVACSGEQEPDSVPDDSADTAAAGTAAASPEVPADIRAHIDEHADLVRLESPEPLAVIESPLEVSGRARGFWYFEASFPVVLVDWDGLIIAEGVATADGEWMTEEFVPFHSTLEFETPEYGERGTLILQKHNASGLPEHDDALEVPVRFEGE